MNINQSFHSKKVGKTLYYIKHVSMTKTKNFLGIILIHLSFKLFLLFRFVFLINYVICSLFVFLMNYVTLMNCVMVQISASLVYYALLVEYSGLYCINSNIVI